MSKQPDYTASMSNAVHAALGKRQLAVDQARAVASLLLDRFNAMVQGEEGPDDHHVMAALQVIVERLRSCDDLIDAVRLENAGRQSLSSDMANG
jgi:hypothetical protein